jgi:hypothetical protein
MKPTRNQPSYSSFSKLLCIDHCRGKLTGVDSFTPSKHVFSFLLLMSSDLVAIEGAPLSRLFHDEGFRDIIEASLSLRWVENQSNNAVQGEHEGLSQVLDGDMRKIGRLAIQRGHPDFHSHLSNGSSI